MFTSSTKKSGIFEKTKERAFQRYPGLWDAIKGEEKKTHNSASVFDQHLAINGCLMLTHPKKMSNYSFLAAVLGISFRYCKSKITEK